MYVIATAGHVDHGKSTLIRSLTGVDPDRLQEEKRRGLTIDLGFAWCDLPTGDRVGFVDVPGHERFMSTTIAGLGPVPAVVFVVSADEGWSAQSAEHLAALDALGVRRGVLVVTKCDVANPDPVALDARAQLAGSTLAYIPTVGVSARTGSGMAELRSELSALLHRLPTSDLDQPVRLWVDRVFTIAGIGTVVTGTLPAGTLRVGDRLETGRGEVRARGLQVFGEQAASVTGVTRVGVNVRGAQVCRGQALVTPGAWIHTTMVDVALKVGVPAGRATLHVGTAAIPVRMRPLGDRAARLHLATALPLRIGDRGIVRDAGRRGLLVGATVLDVSPPALTRRGAGAARAADLAHGNPDAEGLLRWHGPMRREEMEKMGITTANEPVVGSWLVETTQWTALKDGLVQAVKTAQTQSATRQGLSVEAARRALGLPDQELVSALVAPPLTLVDGIIALPMGLAPAVSRAVDDIRAYLEGRPFHAPTRAWLCEHGVDRGVVAAAVRAGALLDLGQQVLLLVGADREAATLLAQLPQPFTVADTARTLSTTRRVAVPLLEHLDLQGVTRRIDNRQRICL